MIENLTRKIKKEMKKIVSYLGIGVIVVFSLSGLAFVLLSQGLPDPRDFSERQVIQSTKIYDRTGEILLYEIHGGEKRTIVSLDKISSKAINATLAAEDHNFYQHRGFSLKSIGRAIFYSLLNPKKLQGGSTITQQLARNAFLTTKRSIVRKVREAILTVAIEKNYNKNQILEMYLNQINYGHNIYGIESASQFYFNKTAENLTLAESAYLAALIKSPGYLSPYASRRNELESRKNWVLKRTLQLGYYSQGETEKAIQEKVNFAVRSLGLKAPHFVMHVRDILYEKFGKIDLEREGYKIITTLDLRLQAIAEEAIKKYGDLNQKNIGAKNLAILSQDPKTGQILAMVGSRDYWDMEAQGNVNAALAIRQPGSSFKPIVYATAFKKGLLPESIVFDAALDGKIVNFSTDPKNPYHVRNYDETTKGPVSLRQALAQSLNIASVKVLHLAGIGDTIKTAKDFGITTLTEPPGHYGLSLVLGGGGVKLNEMVNAYAALSQDGVFHPQKAILKIENSKGKLVEDFTLESKNVLASQIARMLNSILSDNEARAPTFGWQSKLYFPGKDVAVKTGTDSEYRDAWTIGYTTSLAAGVWAGNNDRSAVAPSGAPGAMLAAPAWREFMEKAMEFYPPENFIKPLPYNPQETKKPMVNGNYIAQRRYKNIHTSEIRTVKEIHNILYYLDRNNLSGPIPKNPSDDPQFWIWEMPVLLWAQQNIPNFDQEYNLNLGSDFIFLDEDEDSLIYFPDAPFIEFIKPKNGDFIQEETLKLEVSIQSQAQITEAVVYLNAGKMGSLYLGENNLYYFSIPRHQLSSQNEIKIEVMDNLSQKNSASIIIFR